MKLRTLTTALALLLLGPRVQAEEYQSNWESIDSRPTPTWWTDAKFGIFIHWGVYSVRAYAPPGEYAEWYWERLNASPDAQGKLSDIHLETGAFHQRNYGEDFEYFDFAPAFRAESFEPEKWAAILGGSGAQYVVLVSKHHDGFALWPSEHANKTWGRPWNSVEQAGVRTRCKDLKRIAESQRQSGTGQDSRLQKTTSVVQPECQWESFSGTTVARKLGSIFRSKQRYEG